jgi:hypothetical protein
MSGEVDLASAAGTRIRAEGGSTADEEGLKILREAQVSSGSCCFGQ